MMEFIALALVCACAIIGSAYAINYFGRTGLKRALCISAFFVGIFLLFWASGLWLNAERHSWGKLTPVFILMILGGALVVWLGIKLWKHLRKE